MSEENTPWKYKPDNGARAGAKDPDDSAQPAERQTRPAKNLAWEAPEYIDSPRGSGWYTGLVIITVGFAAAIYLLTKDKVAPVIIIIVGIIVGFYANQKPGRAKYEITDSGVDINGKLYAYSGYKSFNLAREGELSSVNLFPLKRLMPPLSIYFDPKNEQKVMQALGNFLPYEDRKLDAVDRISRRLRLQ